jgi:hypothetical protein
MKFDYVGVNLDDPTVPAVATFFFATDGNSFVHILSIVPFVI